MATWVIRTGGKDDEGFVAQSWIQTMRAVLPNPTAVRTSTADGDWQKHFRGVVSSTLDRAEVRVAVDPEAEDTIYGFAVFEPDVPRFVYVRKAWRGLGIAKALMSPTQLSRQKLLNWTRYLIGYVHEAMPSQRILELARKAREEKHNG